MASHARWLIGAIILLSGGILWSCATARAGPQAWIDTPLDNTTAPPKALTIVAHASHSGGVASLEFSVDGAPYQAVAAGGGRLEWREIEWTPPGPGTYEIGVRGIGADGVEGEFTTARVTITGDEKLPLPLPKPLTITPTVVTATATATVTATPVTPPAPIAAGVVAKMDANCREGPGTAYEVYGNLLSGERALLKGRLPDNSWLLVLLTGRSSNCWISAWTVDVQGDLNQIQVVSAGQPPGQPPAEQPPASGGEAPPGSILEPPPIELDTTPPSFYNIGAARDSCPAETVTVAAAVADDKGLSSVVANWSMSSGESGQAVLHMGGLGYVGTVGPLATDGTLRIRIVATDTSGLSANSDWLLVEFIQCID